MSSTDGVEKKIFEQDVPFEFLANTLQRLLDSYVEAHAYCKGRYKKPEFRYAYPHIQRANFEGDWRDLAKQHPTGAGAVRKNSSGDSHTRCVFGRVILTQSAVKKPGDFPREAEFRKTLARDQQIPLLHLDDDPPVEESALYAILTHGPRRLSSPLPQFMLIGFPSRDCKKFVDSIDLTPLLREKVTPAPDPVVEVPQEEQPKDMVVRLRDRIKIKKEGA